MRRSLICAAAFLFLSTAVSAQKPPPPGKPVLIRPDEDAKAGEEVYPHDPQKAKKNLEIGDFYYKKDNYEAAADRYREAIKYNLAWPEPYEKLVKTLRKQEQYQEAIDVCRAFLTVNEKPNLAGKFLKLLEELREELALPGV